MAVINVPDFLIKEVTEKKLMTEDGTKLKNVKGIFEEEKLAGIVTDKYKLVKNVELIEALHEASEDIGIDFVFNDTLYYEKKSGWHQHRYIMPFVANVNMKVYDEQGSLYNPVVEIGNSYDGKMSWWVNVNGERDVQGNIYFYVIRKICSNGMVGKVKINSFDEVRENEQVYIGTEDTHVEETYKAIRKTHRTESKKELIKRKIAAGFEQNQTVARFIERAYEQANRKLLEQFIEFVKKTNSIDFELLETMLSGAEFKRGFELINLLTFALTHIVKKRSYERYIKYQNFIWRNV